MKKNNEKKVNIRMLAEAGVMIALAFILNSIKLYKMPQGGSITPGGYVPLLIFALRWGTVPGVIVGAIYGILDCLVDPFIVAPLQFLLDYPLSYGMLGLAGLGRNKKNMGDFKISRSVVAVVFANIMKMVMAVLSGIVFFGAYLPKGISVLYSSFLYNGLYIIPNTIISVTLIIFLLPRLKKVKI